MNNLKTKTLLLLWGILSIFVILLLSIFNYLNYNQEYLNVESKLVSIEKNLIRFPYISSSNDNKYLFLDNIIYIVNFNSDNQVSKIISYNDEEVDKRVINNITYKHLKKDDKLQINNLFINKYATLMTRHNNLIILDCSINNYHIIKNLKLSIIIFLIVEIGIMYLSYILTKWLVKPVQDIFLKQKQFIYDASHELKTPLAVILASSETALNNPLEEKWVNNIKNEAERMSELVNNLLTLAKMENNLNNKEYELVNLSKIIEIATLSFESLIYENNLKLDYQITENIKFNCHKEEMTQLLGILLDNAIKHSYKSSTIKVNLSKFKDHIYLEVINKGKPIKDEDKEKIFERFYRSDNSRNREENRYGLGLAIAKNIVLNHQGKIECFSKNGYTTFKVEFKEK